MSMTMMVMFMMIMMDDNDNDDMNAVFSPKISKKNEKRTDEQSQGHRISDRT